MINFAIGFVIAGIVAYIYVAYFWSPKEKSPSSRGGERVYNLNKLEEYIKTNRKKITNDGVQDLLGVSDATATRYLDEMEKTGLITQVGDVGQSVYYQKR